MHDQAFNWLSRMVRERVLPAMPGPMMVLECGALDVNGSARPLFPHASYIGLDRLAGKGADLVADIAGFDGKGAYDVVVSTETLEHMERPTDLLTAAHRALRPGGMLLLTAAAPPRKPHRCDGTEGDLRGEHYANVDPAELHDLLILHGFTSTELTHDAEHGDVYALAVKA
jgi:SAM-dependent methyltransferase